MTKVSNVAVDEGGLGCPIRPPESRGLDLSDLAKSYTDIAFGTLVDVAINGTSNTARIAVANAILDRGSSRHRHSPS